MRVTGQKRSEKMKSPMNDKTARVQDVKNSSDIHSVFFGYSFDLQDRQTDRQTGRQADRETDRERETERERDRERGTEREGERQTERKRQRERGG